MNDRSSFVTRIHSQRWKTNIRLNVIEIQEIDSSYLVKMGKFEMFLSNLCPPHSIKAFTICLYEPGS